MRAPGTGADRLRHRRLLHRCIERGQIAAGIGCIAVTVPTQDPPVDAASCSLPLARFSDEHLREIVAVLDRTAKELAAIVVRGR